MIGEITTVWTSMSQWFADTIGDTQAIFYASDKLTFLGTLSVIGVAVGVSLLVINKVQDFLKLR